MANFPKLCRSVCQIPRLTAAKLANSAAAYLWGKRTRTKLCYTTGWSHMNSSFRMGTHIRDHSIAQLNLDPSAAENCGPSLRSCLSSCRPLGCWHAVFDAVVWATDLAERSVGGLASLRGNGLALRHHRSAGMHPALSTTGATCHLLSEAN